MTGRLSKNFLGVGIGPLSKILAVKSCSRVSIPKWYLVSNKWGTLFLPKVSLKICLGADSPYALWFRQSWTTSAKEDYANFQSALALLRVKFQLNRVATKESNINVELLTFQLITICQLCILCWNWSKYFKKGQTLISIFVIVNSIFFFKNKVPHGIKTKYNFGIESCEQLIRI